VVNAAALITGMQWAGYKMNTITRYNKSGKPIRCFCGADMIPAGIGKYPYDCIAKDKYPRAMVYKGCNAGHTCWDYDASMRTKQIVKHLLGL